MNLRLGTKPRIIMIGLILTAICAAFIFVKIGKSAEAGVETAAPTITPLQTATPTPTAPATTPTAMPTPSPTPTPAPESYKYFILLDPGHGDNDLGTPAGKIYEKNIVLSIAEKIYKMFENDKEYKIYMTRYDDSYPSLDDRIAAADEFDVDFMVSIHANFYEPDASVHGTETYYSEEAKALAETIHNSLIEHIGSKDRGRKDNNGYYILKNALKPTILIETGFMSNPAELEKLASEEYQDKIAKGIYEGIKKVCE